MSIIIDPTSPSSFSLLPNGGFEFVGLENNPNRLNGTEQRDSITGGNLADLLSGLAGDDTISGLAGDDTIFGCEGNDMLQGGDGNDSVEGGIGRDILIGTQGDVLDGGEGQDALVSDGSGNTMTGGLGLDRFGIDLTQKTVDIPDQITDYQQGEKIVIRGTTPTANITYNQTTGMLSVNGEEIVQLSPGSELDLGDVEYL